MQGSSFFYRRILDKYDGRKWCSYVALHKYNKKRNGFNL